MVQLLLAAALLPTGLPSGIPVKATMNCQALNRPEKVVAKRTYTLVEYGRTYKIGGWAVLTDAAHPGDGYASLYIRLSCLAQ